MTVVVLIRATMGLRGHVARWLVQVAPGVYVGTVSARVREQLWRTVIERLGKGRAVLIHAAQGEQGWKSERAGYGQRVPVDFDGLTLFKNIRP